MNSSSPDPQSASPDEQVAQRIVTRLLTQGLIAPGQADALRSDLPAGNLKAADWRLIAEKAVELEVRNAQAH